MNLKVALLIGFTCDFIWVFLFISPHIEYIIYSIAKLKPLTTVHARNY